MLQAGQPRRKLLGQEVVVQPCANQFRRNGRRKRGRIEMGQSTGMGWLIGPIHDLLKVYEKGFNAGPFRPRGHVRQGTHHRDGSTVLSGADPPAEQI